MPDNRYIIGDVVFERYYVTGERNSDDFAEWYSCAGINGERCTVWLCGCSQKNRNQVLDWIAKWKKVTCSQISHPIAQEFLDDVLILLLNRDISAMTPVSELTELYSESGMSPKLCGILLQSAAVLAELEAQGFIYGDIKPDNLLWDGEKLWLYGLLLTLGGFTPAYCSMEQMEGKPFTGKTDVYSWAVSIMELCLGNRPWNNGVSAGMNCKEYLSEINPPLPEGMAALLKECLSLEAEDRPDASQINQRLRKCLPDFTGKTWDGKYDLIKLLEADPPFKIYDAEETESGRRVRLLMPSIESKNDDKTKRLLYDIYVQSTSVYDRKNDEKHTLAWFDPGFYDGQIRYLVSDQPFGVSLECWLKTHAPLRIETALMLTIQLLQALSRTHGPCDQYMGDGDYIMGDHPGFVHRCVSPNNIRIVEGEMPKLLLDGFGCAAARGEEIKKHSQFCGIVAFSPRQQLIDADNPCVSWDVWAAAACLYYMLTGKFPKDLSGNVWKNLVKNKPAPIREHRADVPAKLADVIDCALDDSAEELHYSTAKQLLDALEQVIAYEAQKTVLEGGQTVLEDGRTVLEGNVTILEASGQRVFVKGERILDTYRVESSAIESGGMGRVWRVRHGGWNVDLAMKQPRREHFTDEDSKTGFIRECQTWINLGLHPHIVSCYYVREIEGIPTIFSEWMDGGSLADTMESGRLYEGTEAEQNERILDIAVQFARGLHYAHEYRDENGEPHELVHQDVKPGNLLLTGEWEAKVADFGLARALTLLATENDKIDRPEEGGYTPAYCAMEQMDGYKLTRRTDIYSWAVSVMEMYIGSRPWANGVVAGLNCREYFEKTRVLMPEDMKKLLAKCLESYESARPRDFSAVEEELLRIYQRETGRGYFRPASKAAADTAENLNNRALSFLDLNKPEQAERCWERAFSLERENKEIVYNNRLFQWRSGRISDLEMLESIKEFGDFMVEMVNAERRSDMLCQTTARYRFFPKPNYDRIGVSKDDRFALTYDFSKKIYTLDREGASGGTEKIEIPLADGAVGADFLPEQNRMITAEKSGLLRQWDLTEGKPIGKSIQIESSLKHLNYLPEAAAFAVGCEDGSAAVYSIDSMGILAMVKYPGQAVKAVSISRDGSRMLCGYQDGILRLWNVVTHSCIRELDQRSGIIISAALHPDQEIAAVSCKGSDVRLIRLDTGQCLRSFQRETGSISSDINYGIRFEDDGKSLAFTVNYMNWKAVVPYSATDQVKVSLSEFQPRCSYFLSRVKKTVEQLAENLAFAGFIAQAQKALEAGQPHEGILALKKAREITGMRQNKSLLELNDALGSGRQAVGLYSCWPECELFSPDYPDIDVLAAGPEGQLLTSVQPSKMNLFDYRTGQELRKFGFPITDRIRLIRAWPDGDLAAEFSRYTRVIRLWNLKKGLFLTSITLNGGYASNMIFSHNGSMLAVSSETDVSVYETDHFHLVARTETGFEVNALSFISDTELLLLSSRKGIAQRWDTKGNRFTVIHSGRERTPYFASSDGKYFLVQKDEEKAEIYQSSGEFLCEISCDRTVSHCEFNQGGQALLIGGGEGSVHQLSDGRCLHHFGRIYGQILKGCFSREGNRVMLAHEKSESHDGGISVWYLDRMFD